jgi:hypothetical protein
MDVPLVVLMPVVVATSDNMGDGCYAQLYDGQNFPATGFRWWVR